MCPLSSLQEGARSLFLQLWITIFSEYAPQEKAEKAAKERDEQLRVQLEEHKKQVPAISEWWAWPDFGGYRTVVVCDHLTRTNYPPQGLKSS